MCIFIYIYIYVYIYIYLQYIYIYIYIPSPLTTHPSTAGERVRARAFGDGKAF